MRLLGYYNFCLLFNFFVCSCHTEKAEDGKAIPCLDLNKSYPPKELFVQTVAKVTYIPLETDTLYLLDGRMPKCVSRDYFIFYVKRTGSLLFFASDGKKMFSINRKGNGPEEYIGIRAVAFDEKTRELYCVLNFDKVIKVYSEEGIFRRNLPLNADAFLEEIANYNDSLLLCWNNNIEGTSEYYFLHKKVANSTRILLTVPADRKVDRGIVECDHLSAIGIDTPVTPLVCQRKGYLLADPSNDTIYRLAEGAGLEPVFCRTPSVREMNPQVLLDYGLESDDYAFITAVEKQYDFQTGEGLAKKTYLLEKATGQLYRSHICNRDYPDDPEFTFSAYEMVSGQWLHYYAADILREAFENGQLSGELKQLASQLGEEDNGIVMRIEFLSNQ